MNTFDYMTTAPGAITSTNMAALVAGWITDMDLQYRACLTPATSCVAVLGQCLSSGSVVSINSQWTGIGSVLGSQLPLEMAAIITKYSNLKGQHGRGRVMMPAIPVSFCTPVLDPNLLNNVGKTAYATLAADYLSGYTVGAVVLKAAILTRPIRPAHLVTTGILVSSLTVQSLLGTVRRRREGRGI